MTTQTPARTINHGTLHAYRHHHCRCADCRAANAEKTRRSASRKRGEIDPVVDHEALADLLNELFPDGLTDDAPNRRAQQAA